MDPYLIFLGAFGLAILAVAWLPLLLRELPLSLPIFCVAFGFLIFGLLYTSDRPHPLAFPYATERLTELLVIISLMGVGLKISRWPTWRDWMITWRLLGITMPLSIAALAVLAWWIVGLAPAAAILLASALAPTDPGLASDVQLGPPGSY